MGLSLQEETGRERCETSSFYRLSPQIPASLGFTQGSQQKQHTHIYIYIFLYRFPISSGFWHWENAKFIIHKKHILLIIEIIIMIFPPFSANSKSRLHVLPAAGWSDPWPESGPDSSKPKEWLKGTWNDYDNDGLQMCSIAVITYN